MGIVINASHRFGASASATSAGVIPAESDGPSHAIRAAQKILGPLVAPNPIAVPLVEVGKKMARPTTVKRVTEYLGPDKDINPDQLHLFEKQGGWIIEPKMDGMWASLLVGSPQDGVPHILKSRDARTPAISGANLGDLHTTQLPFEPGTILVGELEASTQHAKNAVDKQGYRRLHVFDVVRLGSASTTDLLWFERRAALSALYDGMHDASEAAQLRFPLLTFGVKDFKAYYDSIVATGEEGVVLKRSDSLYKTSRSDGKTEQWLRCKRWVTDDFVLMGTEMTAGGKYAAPKPTGVWGQYNAAGKLTRCFAAPCKPETLHLNAANHGVLVAEFMGWAKMKSGALRHAQFVRVRTDKPREDCKL